MPSDCSGRMWMISKFFIYDSCILSYAVDLRELVCLPVAAKWRSLGIQLGITLDQLSTIQANHQSSPTLVQDCLASMFSLWLSSDRASYQVLEKALIAIERRDLAVEIQQKQGMIFHKVFSWLVLYVHVISVLYMYV